MTDQLHRSIVSGNGSAQNIPRGITEADVLVTAALASRPTRQPDLAAEIQALKILAPQLMDNPLSMLQTLVGIAIDLTQAGTAGVSLLETAPNGESVFRWVAIAGVLADLEQTTTPGDFSPCGTTLRSNQPQIYSYPERYFTYLHHPQFPIVEGLLIPLVVNRQPLGTLWLLSHEEARRFDLEDQRLMTSLAGFTASALQSIQQLHQKAEEALQREQEAQTQQKRAVVALRQSQEVNQQILDCSDDCIKLFDLEGRILFMSYGGQALLGIQDITPFLKKSWAEFWEGADQQAAIFAIAAARAGEVCTFQGYRPTLTGEPKWWDSKISPIRGADGQVERLLCISRDITERRRSEDKRKQAEERLQKSEEHLSAIFSQASVGLSEIALDGRFQRVNDELCRMLGRSREELLATGVPDVTHPEDVLKSLQAFEQLVETGKSVSLDQRYLRSDGMIVWANSSFTRLDDEQGHPSTVLAVTVDLSDRKQAEEKLRESEERYRAIVNQAVTGVAYSDLGGKLTIVNQKYCEITGYSAAELSQLRMRDFTHPEDLPRNIELYNRMLAEGTPFESEKRYIRKDGSIVWVNNSVSAICDRDGKPQSVVAIVLDVTDRKQAEEISRRSAELNAFRISLADALRPLADPVEVQAKASRVLGEYLGANRVAYFEVRDANYVVERDYVNGASAIAGSYPIDSFGPKLLAAYRTGCAVSVSDVQADLNLSPDQRSAYAAIQIGAYIGIPLLKGGEFVAGLAVHTSGSRVWTPDEVTLAEEVAERTWAAVERAYAEAALRESEEKYRSLFNSLDEGFCLIEVLFDETGKADDYRFLEANQAFEKHTGLVDTIGKTVRELVPQHDAHWFEIYGKIALTGVPARFENAAKELKRFYDVYAFRIGKPHERKVAVLFNDISDRKQAEAEREQLLGNERHYANQLQGLTTAALAINSALSVEEVLQVITNQAASIIGAHQSVTSMTVDQNWTQAIDTVYLSEKYAAWRDYDRPTDGSGIYAHVCHFNRPMRLTQAALETHPLWRGFGEAADKHPPMRGWLAAPLVGRDGNNIGLIQLSDKEEGEFTEADESILVQLAQMASIAVENARLYEAQKQARATAEASREEAQAANRVKDEFLAVLSHELRSPLNPILGWSTLLLNNKLDAAKSAQALAIIQRNAKLQSELIEDLLDVSRILQGKLSLKVAPVNLASIIRAAMETVRLAVEAKSIKLEANLEPDVGLVSGDSTRLQQVIWNLLSNAVKFTPKGGQVNIHLERLDLYAQIAVSDTGQGILPEFLPYVFDYFRQADSTITRKFGGLGLGLAIVRHLVELHGGAVRVESPGVERGATFTIRLPLMPIKATATQKEQSSESAFDLNGIRVLVVDDDIDSQEFVLFVLEQAGAKVMAARTADEALRMLAQFKPDVLLSDIGMPEMDGYMLLQQVRTLAPEQGGQIPAIAITAYAGDFNQQQALAAGFQQHLAKPIEPDMLVASIVTLLSKEYSN